jgi:hypothetical protein
MTRSTQALFGLALLAAPVMAHTVGAAQPLTARPFANQTIRQDDGKHQAIFTLARGEDRRDEMQSTTYN